MVVSSCYSSFDVDLQLQPKSVNSKCKKIIEKIYSKIKSRILVFYHTYLY